MMRKWLMVVGVLLALVLMLAACGGDSKDDKPGGGDVPPGVDPDATEEVFEGYDLLPIEPGLKMQSGLTMRTYSLGKLNDIVYFYGEVQNDTGQTLHQVESYLYLVDAENFRYEETTASSMLIDIPPGQVFYIGGDFTTSDAYADAQIWVRYETGEVLTGLQGYFNLPVTVDSRGPSEGIAYLVSGTAQNTSGQVLRYPVIDVALIGPDDNLVGLAHGTLATTTTDGTWPAGETAAWNAAFGFMSVPPESVVDVRVSVSGYAVVDE